MLTGKYHLQSHFEEGDRRNRPEYVNFHGEKFKKNLEIVEMLKKMAEKYQKPLSAVALRFVLDYLPQSIVLAGMKNIGQLQHNTQSLGWKLKMEDLQRLEKISRS